MTRHPPPAAPAAAADPPSTAARPGGGGRFSTVDLRRRIAAYQPPVLHRSLLQVTTSIGGFLAVCAAMYVLAEASPWIALVLAPLAAGFLVRTFIIQHDCGHGAFFRSRRLNDALGAVCSLLTLTPYASWRRQHAGHHGMWNNLDHRDLGVDIYSSCLTVEEYRALNLPRRIWYRVTRNPLIANVVAPPLVFMLLFRVPFDLPAKWRRERIGVHATNIGLVALFGGAGFALGFDRVAIVQIPVMALASIIGAWLFTVQHRADWTVWARREEWNAETASLEGSTYLRLPRPLQWFTGNIGLHHIHHLNPRIPNYRLQQCHDSLTEVRAVPALTLGAALRATLLVLWDESQRRMVTFRQSARDALR